MHVLGASFAPIHAFIGLLLTRQHALPFVYALLLKEYPGIY